MKTTTNMKTTTTSRGRQQGMSLVEIMVGVLVGLIGCVIIFQMYSLAETRKRTIAAGSDMDISGRLGLMTVERDLQLAGYGFGAAASASAGALLGCNVAAYDSQRLGGDFTFAFTPILIQDGGPAPDTLISLRGSSSLAVAPKFIDESTAASTRVRSDTGGRTGIQRGDLVIATETDGAASCAMFEITGDANADQVTLDHVPGTYTDPNDTSVQLTARYNKAGGFGFVLPADGGTLYNLGRTPVRNIWTVQNGKLLASNDLTAAAAIEAADLVVDLQAQYGVDTSNPSDGIVDVWTDANPAEWRRLIAVRFALLARSTQFEPSKVTPTTANPRWSSGAFMMRNIDGTADNDPGDPTKGSENNWRNYRYNVFEAVVPLRNTIAGRQL